jgi:hypothetical protein
MEQQFVTRSDFDVYGCKIIATLVVLALSWFVLGKGFELSTVKLYGSLVVIGYLSWKANW